MNRTKCVGVAASVMLEDHGAGQVPIDDRLRENETLARSPAFGGHKSDDLVAFVRRLLTNRLGLVGSLFSQVVGT